ncbi:MAG TPA: hypothetical protein VME18_02160 [Acidobacteriaceae bacterium]|nr:hypothetical protein [Acidobacteriaceae bacterium]
MRYAQTLLCFVIAATAPAAFAGGSSRLKSSSASVNLVAVVNEELSIVPASPAINSAMQPQVIGQEDRPLTVTTSWNLSSDGNGFAVRAFFDDSGRTLASEDQGARPAVILASEITGGASIGTLHPFPSIASTSAGPTRGAGFLVFHHQLMPGRSEFSSHTDAVELPADPACQSRDTPCVRSGVLTLVAVAY